MPEKADKELKTRWMQFEGSYRLKSNTDATNLTKRYKTKNTPKLKIYQHKRTHHQPYLKRFKHIKQLSKDHKFLTVTTIVPLVHVDQVAPSTFPQLQGPKWDGENLTCAIDTVIASLQNIYNTIGPDSRLSFMNMSPWVDAIRSCDNISLLRNDLLHALNYMSPEDFPLGPHMKSVDDVIDSLFYSSILDCFLFTYYCETTNQFYQHQQSFTLLNVPHDLDLHCPTTISISDLLGPSRICLYCRQYHVSQSLTLNSEVPIIFISYNISNSLSTVPTTTTVVAETLSYFLRAIVFYNNGHFTCTLHVDGTTLWYDGMQNNGITTTLHNGCNLLHYQNHDPIMFLYSM